MNLKEKIELEVANNSKKWANRILHLVVEDLKDKATHCPIATKEDDIYVYLTKIAEEYEDV